MSAADPFDLQRFVDAQQSVYAAVRAELARGAKSSHWMWFVFPQLEALGRSATARRYGIGSIDEARAYLGHPLLGARLRECTRLVLAANEGALPSPSALAAGGPGRDPALGATGTTGRSLEQIFGGIDALKFRSSMTLFAAAAPDEALFAAAIERSCGGRPDPLTVDWLDGVAHR